MSDGQRERLALSRGHVRAQLAKGADWEQVGRELNISPGLAFMVASGIPADGSGSPELPLPAPSRPQELVNPHTVNPLTHEATERWVHERARRDLVTAKHANGAGAKRGRGGDAGGQRATSGGAASK